MMVRRVVHGRSATRISCTPTAVRPQVTSWSAVRYQTCCPRRAHWYGRELASLAMRCMSQSVSPFPLRCGAPRTDVEVRRGGGGGGLVRPHPLWHMHTSLERFLVLTPCVTDRDDQLWPAGRHVPQTSGDPTRGLPEWIGDGKESIDNTDIVLWHTFGVTHIPSPEDFPVMPVEPITLLLRPRNFFSNNPVMDVPPSFASTPSQVAAQGDGVLDARDKLSKLACCDKLSKL